MTKLPDAGRIAEQLTVHYGLPLSGHSKQDEDGHEYVELYPDGVHRNDGFCVRLNLGWRSLKGEFVPGSFAAPLIEEMGKASDEDKAVFSALVKRMQAERGTVEMQVNGNDVDPAQPETWPSEWKRLALVMEKSPLAVNTEDKEDTEKALIHWGGRFLAAILALTPLEDIAIEDPANPDGLPEGAMSRIEVNKYERNRFNRAACIEIYGDICSACGFDFGKVYGALGRGYIHVHHITPVSEMVEGYRVNPAKDLIPVCANCHAMLHRHTPPYSVEELKSIFDEQTAMQERDTS